MTSKRCGVKQFCSTCFKCFLNTKEFANHDCEKVTLREQNKNKTIIKDVAHDLRSEFSKGSRQELDTRLSRATRNHEQILEEHNNPRIITFDFETDTHTLTHILNHCEVEVLTKVHDTHDYQKSLIGS